MYILVTGPPGSKWSSVVKNIYWSDDIDHTDYSEERTYWHDADTPGHKQLMHIGAYWDPGMEFMSIDWDGPFSGTGKRIVKCHTFAHELEELKNKGYPIVMVQRPSYSCREWWKLCGGFNITYPNYEYYANMNEMWKHIKKQNRDIGTFIRDNSTRVTRIHDNKELCEILEITQPKDFSLHDYKEKDIIVNVYK